MAAVPAVLTATVSLTAAAAPAQAASLCRPREHQDAMPEIARETAICLYREGGNHFELPHCTTCNPYDWNSVGSWYSRQTGGVGGKILDRNRKPIQWMGPEPSWPRGVWRSAVPPGAGRTVRCGSTRGLATVKSCT
ncbi:hypothetical protein [Streptomyces sp. NBC_01276]|uniref:hypothetical protein n=1 Tax=Streptomyces sp. NBC_01276 TaxID=2903808 RepID=UPI00352C6AE1